ncbi:MAG: phytase [Hyphomicrobiales bacterium]
MLKSIKLFLYLLSIIIISSCDSSTSQRKGATTEYDFVKVSVDRETDPVPNSGDAADDAAIWINNEDLDNSVIYGTDKKGGIIAYNLHGKLIKYYPVGDINNIDIRYDFPIDPENPEDKYDIVGVSNSSDKSFMIFRINKATGKLYDIGVRSFATGMEDTYGFAFYKSPTGNFYAFVSDKQGQVQQWIITAIKDNHYRSDKKVDAKLVRSFSVPSKCEGMVADDLRAVLFVAEEKHGIWSFLAEPEEGSESVQIFDIESNPNLEMEIEGLTIIYTSPADGYLVASSQGNSSYAVFERQPPYKYIGSFKLVDSGHINGTMSTDGIAGTAFGLGAKWPEGLFIAQDGTYNKENKKENQNFKLVSWGKIARKFNPNLLMSPTYNQFFTEESE